MSKIVIYKQSIIDLEKMKILLVLGEHRILPNTYEVEILNKVFMEPIANLYNIFAV